MSAPATLGQVYCTDEDLALRAPQDFAALAPVRLAGGVDGTFSGASPWVLASASVDFLACGIPAGSTVVRLTKQGTFAAPGELFAVDQVGAGSATLRRLGFPPGVGIPPAPAAGLAGVSFEVRTFANAIDTASYDANKFFGIDPNVPSKDPARLYDARELQQFTVLTVLRRAYIAAAKAKSEDFALKLADVSGELDDLRSRLIVHWGPQGQGDAPNSVFSARLRR